MADVSSGLETGEGSELDPNTDLGFNTLLARQVAGGEGLSDEQEAALRSLENVPSRDIESGLTQESARVPSRDDRGRFAPAAPAETEEEGAAPVEEQHTEEDPALAEFLSRHGGDANAALAAALQENEEAQKLIGRQGNELGEKRQREQELAERLARLEGRMEATPAQPSPYAAQPIAREQLEGAFEQSEHEGWDVMGWAADNRPDLIEDVYKIWKEYNPSDAALWRFRYETNLEGGRQQEPAAAPEPDPILKEMHQQRDFNVALETVKNSYADTDWELISPHLVEALSEDADETIAALVTSADPAQRVSGLKVVAKLAKVRAVEQARTQLREEQKGKAVESKKAASVATGSLRPVAERQPEEGTPASKEEIRQRLHDALLKTETKDVAAGLTYGS